MLIWGAHPYQSYQLMVHVLVYVGVLRRPNGICRVHHLLRQGADPYQFKVRIRTDVRSWRRPMGTLRGQSASTQRAEPCRR